MKKCEIESLNTHYIWLLYYDWFTSYLIRALIPYHSNLLVLLNHVVIVFKLCCVEGLMEDRCTSNKHFRWQKSLLLLLSLLLLHSLSGIDHCKDELIDPGINANVTIRTFYTGCYAEYSCFHGYTYKAGSYIRTKVSIHDFWNGTQFVCEGRCTNMRHMCVI